MHWKTIARDHNEIADQPFTEGQLTTFLNSALSGTPGLNSILRTTTAARRAAGVRTNLNYEEYIQALLEQAQVHDGANTRTTNPRSQRGVNIHELEFDDEEHPDDNDPYEVQEHDIDTPIEDLTGIDVMQTDQTRRTNNPSKSSRDSSQPRKVRVDFSTWNKLTSKDQEKWDDVSESGKGILLQYAAKNPDKYLQVAELPNVHKAAMLRISQKTQGKRSINSHELLFEEDAPEDDSKIDVQTHEHNLISFEDLVPPKEKTAPNLLEMATKKTSKQDWSASSVDINHVLSASKKTPREVTLHEQYIPRSDNTPYEINVHRVKFMGGIIEVPSDEEEEQLVPLPDTLVATNEPDYFDLLSTGNTELQVAKKEGPFVDLLSPDNLKNSEFYRSYDEVNAELNPKPTVAELDQKPPAKHPQYMQGRFSEVEKPTPMLDRIKLNDDGNAFTYTKTPSHSSSNPGSGQQSLEDDFPSSSPIKPPLMIATDEVHPGSRRVV